MSIVKAVRGTRDLLPPETELWNRVESVARAVFARYGFGEIRTPIFEPTELFVRGVGEETDVVSKEMYTFPDGDRFDLESMSSWWMNAKTADVSLIQESGKYSGVLREHGVQRQVGWRKPHELPGFVIFRDRISSDAVEILLKARIVAKSQAFLRAFSDAEYFQNRHIRLTLVVPAGTASAASWVEKGDVEIEEVPREIAFKSSQSLTLRPENTAGVVRAYIEHKMESSGALRKLFYIGPQFRRERPQRGRYRQFWQIGAEVLGPTSSGAESPIRDAEVLEMLASFLDELGIQGWKLELNSVGSATDRPRYVAALREALAPVKDSMCEDNRRRAETNPLRVLDSKEPSDQDLINALPKIADYLDDASKDHFAQVLAALDACGVPYTVNPRLVRGLDYYTRTTFEFTVPDGSGLGTQNALLGGGRYDGLSEMLGGPRAPGIGFAIGEDRLILTLQAQQPEAAEPKLDAYIAPLGPAQNPAALALARDLRRAGLAVEVGDGTFRLRKSFEAADRAARNIILLGEDEAATGLYTIKRFSDAHQTKSPVGELITALQSARS